MPRLATSQGLWHPPPPHSLFQVATHTIAWEIVTEAESVETCPPQFPRFRDLSGSKRCKVEFQRPLKGSLKSVFFPQEDSRSRSERWRETGGERVHARVPSVFQVATHTIAWEIVTEAESKGDVLVSFKSPPKNTITPGFSYTITLNPYTQSPPKNTITPGNP